MVRQLLTVSRLDSGVLRPVAEVFALGPRVRRAWEALGASGVPFTLDDRAGGWLALADPDQVDQVIWGLLDNAVKYGGGTPITVSVALVPGRRAAPRPRDAPRAAALCACASRMEGPGSPPPIAGASSNATRAAPCPAPTARAWASTSRASWRAPTAATWCWIPRNRGRAISRRAERLGRADRRPRPAPHSRSRSRRSPPRKAERPIRSPPPLAAGPKAQGPPPPGGPETPPLRGWGVVRPAGGEVGGGPGPGAGAGVVGDPPPRRGGGGAGWAPHEWGFSPPPLGVGVCGLSSPLSRRQPLACLVADMVGGRVA